MDMFNNITRQIAIDGQLLLPFYNLWNENAYYRNDGFTFNPFTINSSSTSGSPVAIGRNFFVGFLNPEAPAQFSSDGRMLTVECREGQECFWEEDCDPFAAWDAYNREVFRRFKPVKTCNAKTLESIEYCTWVEQEAALYRRNIEGETVFSMLSDRFIEDYIGRIDRMGLPHGVLTIDHGWMEGSPRFDFRSQSPDRKRFPDLARTIGFIRDSGFIPGLWFAPAFLYEDHPLFLECPELMGSRFLGANENGFEFPVHYLNVTDVTRPLVRQYFTGLLKPYLEMGVKKLKIDFIYNSKIEMIKILRELYQTVKEIDPEVEIESHVPDIFASFYQDAVRMNDVSKPDIEESLALIRNHYLVCKHSAFNTAVNLDHVGTNSCRIGSGDFLRTVALFRQMDGYPVVSLLPDQISDKAVAGLKEYLEGYISGKNFKA